MSRLVITGDVSQLKDIIVKIQDKRVYSSITLDSLDYTAARLEKNPRCPECNCVCSSYHNLAEHRTNTHFIRVRPNAFPDERRSDVERGQAPFYHEVEFTTERENRFAYQNVRGANRDDYERQQESEKERIKKAVAAGVATALSNLRLN